VTSDSPSPPGDALVLAAGNGDRFQNATGQSKLLQPFLGQPLILRTIDTARQAGIRSFEVVLGYQADSVRTVIERGLSDDVTVRFSYNPDWHLENGLSVLAARQRLDNRRFALLMGDHLFESRVLAGLLHQQAGIEESLLAVDSRSAEPSVAAEATKVKLDGSRIIAIGKNLHQYDALDTGLFVCAPALFAALDTARASGDTTLSGGIRHLAGRGLMFGVDVGDAAWYDIDTVADLQGAETLLGAQPEPA
jgi:choline kinase